MYDNIVKLTAIVQEPLEGRTNPSRVSEIFTACSVAIRSGKGTAWLDVVAGNGLASELSKLSPGDTFDVTGRLDSHKSSSDGKYRVRVWADELETWETKA
jgi:hypothetical protein